MKGSHIALCVLCATVLLISCQAPRLLYGDGHAGLRKQFRTSGLTDDHFTGFVLYDPEKRDWVYTLNSDKYFTPASNTKILTYFAAIQTLGDSIEGLRYIERGDSMIFWGTGDPSLLNPGIHATSHVLEFFGRTDKTLVYGDLSLETERYGPGWAWDDYAYAYQVERTAFPIYGNRAWIFKPKGSTNPVIRPSYFAPWLTYQVNPGPWSWHLGRDESANAFYYDFTSTAYEAIETGIPFLSDTYLVTALLADTLKRDVIAKYAFVPPDSGYQVVYSVPADSLYRPMMQMSDNFLAEQIMMLCGNTLFRKPEVDRTIDTIEARYFEDAPDPFLWYDGSGLSRYNLFTPRSIAWLLEQILIKQPFEDIERIFPAGGRSGTIEGWYDAERPYVWAKTGTLRNKHALSGYLRTDTGKILIFSFMHNNYPGSSSSVKPAMEKILRYIKQRF